MLNGEIAIISLAETIARYRTELLGRDLPEPLVDLLVVDFQRLYFQDVESDRTATRVYMAQRENDRRARRAHSPSPAPEKNSPDERYPSR